MPPWFTLDINQGVLTVHLSKTSPCAFAAEIYGIALGEDVRDDFKFNCGQHLLQAVLESLRCKASGRQDVDVRPLIHCFAPFVTCNLQQTVVCPTAPCMTVNDGVE